MVVLYAPLRLSPTLTLQRVDGKLGEATVYRLPVTLLVFVVNCLAN